MARAHGAVTVADVAAHAAVSIGTVSKVLNGRGQLSATTRQRVLDAARELNFKRRSPADITPLTRTYTVGVLTTDSIGRFTIPLLTGAEDALGAGEMAMLLCESRGDAIREQHYLRTLLARRVDGIIVTGRSSDPRPSLGPKVPVPVVYALTQSDDPNDVSIVLDDAAGATMAVEHLLETGRRRIVHITGPAYHASTRHRLDGARLALTAAGLDFVTNEAIFGDWSERSGREAIATLIRNGVDFDGVFCGSDQIARGALDGLRESGVSVPKDVAVIGVDNWDVMVEAARPTLSTIDLNLTELGRRAATRLLEAIDGNPRAAGLEQLPCRLVKRDSTAVV